MKIAILHHHLNRGGVTQVVRSQLRALQCGKPKHEVSQVLVLHGGRAEGWQAFEEQCTAVPVRVAVVTSLDYDERAELHIHELADALAHALDAAGFGPDETVLHVHNHSLGRNVSLPGALRKLAQRGYHMLLQIHDFAEDGRPANYHRVQQSLAGSGERHAGNYLYPIAPQIHYALLNSRDRTIFLSSQVAPSQVHLLPNSATAPTDLPSRESALKRFQQAHGTRESQRLVLYPVRGIRRKNLGEFLLWAAVADAQTTFALTLPATSRVEVPAFRRWRDVAQRLDLRVLFDVGLHGELSFADNLAAADRVITTSVAEGFGLTFLECWLHHRLLIGRNLPEITRDFAAKGVKLDHLGNAIQIPIAWIGAESFVAAVLELQQQICATYGCLMRVESESLVREKIAGGYVDFAALNTRQQISVIERAAEDPAAATEILALNPWMRDALDIDEARWQPLIEHNAAAIRNGFSLAATASNLASIYGTLFAAPAGTVATLPEPENILNAFLDIQRLCPVRIEP